MACLLVVSLMARLWLFQCLIDSLQGLSQSHKINSHLRLSLLRVVGLKAFLVSDKGVLKNISSWPWFVKSQVLFTKF